MRPGLFKDQLNKINPSTLLTAMGVTGVFSTAYLTGRASFKAAKIIEEEEARRRAHPAGISLTTKERIKLVWPLYVAPVGVGTSTITSIVMANHTAAKKVAALTLASGISERALQEYKAKVVEKLGENKEQAIRDEIVQDRVRNNPPDRGIVIAGSGDVLCFDVTTGRYFISSMEKIKKAENTVNFDIIAHDYASLSSFYDEIGLAPTPYSDSVGWNSSNRLELQITTTISTDERPCLAIDFAQPPFPEYARMW